MNDSIQEYRCPVEQRQKAFSRLLELADEKNNSRAQVSVGILYEEGKFVAQDERKALSYYLTAVGVLELLIAEFCPGGLIGRFCTPCRYPMLSA